MARGGRWGFILAGLGCGLFLIGAPFARAEEHPAPPEARCQNPPDAGAGAAGTGAAVAENHWRTDFVRLCIQTTSPVGVFPYNYPCDHARTAEEVYVDHGEVQAERKSSCHQQLPIGMQTESYQACTTTVELSADPSAGDTCSSEGRFGDQDGGQDRWYRSWTSGSSTQINVDEGVSVVRTHQREERPYGPSTSDREEIDVGPAGAHRTYDDAPDTDGGSECHDDWSLSTSDPTSAGVPPRLPGCLSTRV